MAVAEAAASLAIDSPEASKQSGATDEDLDAILPAECGLCRHPPACSSGRERVHAPARGDAKHTSD